MTSMIIVEAHLIIIFDLIYSIIMYVGIDGLVVVVNAFSTSKFYIQ